MREIKFRGKRIDTGEWVYGLFARKKIGNLICPCIQSEKEWDFGDFIDFIEIDGRTLGQYTGLKDDTGRETYTKDIYEDLDGKRFMVDFSDGMFTANYQHEDRLIPLIDCLNGGKFVGIYHENPELLKGDENA